MTIFGDSRLGRIGYAIALAFMICLDFAKSPIMQFTLGLLNKTTKEMWANVPNDPTMSPIDKPLQLDAHMQGLSDRVVGLQILVPAMPIILGAITVITLLWMVSSRIRDIGLPQSGLLVVMSPILIPRVIPLPEIGIQGITLVFYAMLVILALIPGPDDHSRADEAADEPEIPPQPVVRRAVATRQPGQFGRRGT